MILSIPILSEKKKKSDRFSGRADNEGNEGEGRSRGGERDAAGVVTKLMDMSFS